MVDSSCGFITVAVDAAVDVAVVAVGAVYITVVVVDMIKTPFLVGS